MIYDTTFTVNDRDAGWRYGSFFVTVGPALEDFVSQTKFTTSDFQFGGSPTSPTPDATVTEMLANIGQFDQAMTNSYMTRSNCRDTTLGGNEVINPLPQYCEFDDVANPLTDATKYGGYPMGRKYQEAFDNNNFILWMSFGIPVYNYLSAFYTNAVNDTAATAANRGVAYVVANTIGSLLAAPTALAIRAPALALDWVSRIFNYDDAPITRYSDFQSEMPMYYRFVNAMLIKIGTNLGFLDAPDTIASAQTTTVVKGTADTAQNTNASPSTNLIRGTPDYISKLQLDVGRILMRRMLYQYGNTVDINSVATDRLLGATSYGGSSFSLVGTLAGAVEQYVGGGSNAAAQTTGQTDKQGQTIPPDPSADSTSNVLRNWTAAMQNGIAIGAHPSMYLPLFYIGVRIERGQAVTETLQNTYKKSDVQRTLNSGIQAEREKFFTFGHGKIANVPGLNAILDTVGQAVGGLANGVTSTLGLSGLTSLLTGAGMIDIPEEWEDSTFNRNYHFSVTLRAESGDSLTILQSIFYPFSFLWAGACPRGTGDASYTQPFLCKAYCKGLLSVPLGAIDQMTITRGDDAFGYSIDRLPMEMRIDFTIRDLTGIMYMAYDNETSLTSLVIGNNSNYSEYIDTITAMDWNQRFGWTAQRRRWRNFLNGWLQNKLNPVMLGMGVGSNTMVRVLNRAGGLIGVTPVGIGTGGTQAGSANIPLQPGTSTQ